MGPVESGVSRAVSKRANASLVAVSRRSGSSSSGAAVVSGTSSAARAGTAERRGCRMC